MLVEISANSILEIVIQDVKFFRIRVRTKLSVLAKAKKPSDCAEVTTERH